jgi:hypothetical protein
MLTDLRIVLPNRPGAVTTVCGALADAGINVEGVCGDLRPGERWGYVHIVVEAADEAKRMIEDAGYEVTTARPVEMVPIKNEPGELVRVLREYSDRDLNIDVMYIASGDRLVISTEEMLQHRTGVNVQDART